jgi:hypothetical protein
MHTNKENRRDFLFTALMVVVCLWAFSSVGASSFSKTLRSKSQVAETAIVASKSNEFVASVNYFPLNDLALTITDILVNQTSSSKSLDLIFNLLAETEFKSCSLKSLSIKPEISRTSMDYILSSNMGVEYQSIS